MMVDEEKDRALTHYRGLLGRLQDRERDAQLADEEDRRAQADASVAEARSQQLAQIATDDERRPPLEPGERLHSTYVKHFRHRYGGNVPGWHGIHAFEREVWAKIEVEARTPLCDLCGRLPAEHGLLCEPCYEAGMEWMR